MLHTHPSSTIGTIGQILAVVPSELKFSPQPKEINFELKTEAQLPAGANFSLLHTVQTGSGAY
jgi:hypothetical protein